MKILCTGDLHLRYKRPEMRLDESYFETQSDKVQQIFDIAEEKGCEAILQPGDFFDSVDTSWVVVQHYTKMFLDKNKKRNRLLIHAVLGQHDMRHHTREIENTPMGVLEAAGAVSVLRKQPKVFTNANLYGWWWGVESPEFDVADKGINILVAHKMIIKEKLWEGQADFTHAGDFLKDHSQFDLIVSGDNHKSFTQEYEGRYLVNCGSLMRSNINQIDHKPVVYIYDTDDSSLKEILLKVQPVKKVLNLDQAQIQKERDEKLELFISTLKKGKTESKRKFDFVERLYEGMETNNILEDVREIIEEVLK